MTPQELHLSILERAFQGRLTERIHSDGTGTELLEAIKSEKLRLIKAKVIKKEKELPAITEDDIPFDIPESWAWAYVGDVFLHNTGKAQNSSGSANGIVRKFITTSNLYWNRFDFSKVKEMPFTEKELERCTVRKGDLLVCEGGDCGRSAIWYYDEEVCIQNHVHRLRPYVEISIEYFYHLFYLYKFTGKLRGRGVGIQGLSNEAIHQVICPLPPLAEQKRIVAKIEELLPLIDRYEQAWSRLEDFNKRFPVDMQKSILQMAIRGKLVPQLPEEGTGEELFQQIQAEKQALIKAGTIKKEKPLPEITEDEIPFDIPESWKWVRVGDYVQKVTDYVASGSFASLRENVKIYKEPNYAILVKTKDFQSNFTNDLTYTDKHGYEFLENSRLFGGELIMPNIGASIGKVFKVPYLDAKMTLAPNSVLIRFVSEEHLDWFSYYFASQIGFAQLKTISASTAQAKFSKTEFKGLLIPVPPLAEQKRIVSKLEEILPLCERLK